MEVKRLTTDDYSSVAKSLMWLSNHFQEIQQPKDDADRMINCIHQYCENGAIAINELLAKVAMPERHSTGKKDIHGVEICEGDVILLDGRKYVIGCNHFFEAKKGDSCSFSLNCLDLSKAEIITDREGVK